MKLSEAPRRQSEPDTPVMLSFADTVRARHSVRGFLSTPLPDSQIQAVLEDAQRSPSNCNTQPWNVHIVSGAKRDAMSRAIVEASEAGRYSPDFSFAVEHYGGLCSERQQHQIVVYQKALSIERLDKDGRQSAAANNYTFFNAPHVAFLFMPSVGDNVRAASDVGMYGQTFLLALAARGLGGVPQTALGFFADTIREVLGVSSDLKLLFGISFGYVDEAAPANQLAMPRAPLSESVTFHA